MLVQDSVLNRIFLKVYLKNSCLFCKSGKKKYKVQVGGIEPTIDNHKKTEQGFTPTLK